MEGGEVVRAGFDGAFPDVVALSGDVVVEVGANKFQFGVIEVTMSIGPGAQPVGNCVRETRAPDDGDGCGGRGGASRARRL
jgi:hypothetical protein